MPDKDVTISVSHLPYDPRGVIHIPYVWKKWNKDGVISDDLYAAGIAIIAANLERFDVVTLMPLALFADRDSSQIYDLLQEMVDAGMINALDEVNKDYELKPEFVYDPETGEGKA